MKTFSWNLVLALAWTALSGHLSVSNFVGGFVIGYLLLWWIEPPNTKRSYVRKVPVALAFSAFYIFEVVKSTLRVAWDVVTPAAKRRPGILALPLDVKTDEEITLLANLLTFTPGTIALDVTPDRRLMLVHHMFIDDPEAAKATMKRQFERWVIRLMR